MENIINLLRAFWWLRLRGAVCWPLARVLPPGSHGLHTRPPRPHTRHGAASAHERSSGPRPVPARHQAYYGGPSLQHVQQDDVRHVQHVQQDDVGWKLQHVQHVGRYDLSAPAGLQFSRWVFSVLAKLARLIKIQSNLPCQSYLAPASSSWRAKLILDVTLAFFPLQHRNSKFLQLYNITGMHFAGSICESGGGGGGGGGGELSDQMSWWRLLQQVGGQVPVPNYCKVAKY